MAQRGIPIGQYTVIIAPKLTVLIDRLIDWHAGTVLRRRRQESNQVDQRDPIAVGRYFVG